MNSTRFINFNDRALSRRSLAASFKGRSLIVLSLGCVCLASSPFLNAQCDQTCDTDGNTFLGSEAGVSTTAGADNTGVGDSALFHNTLGRYNTATGSHALPGNTTGEQNTAIGGNNLVSNTTGSYNTAIGFGALFNNNGSHNVAFGQNTLLRNERGSNNIAIGPAAGLVVKNGSWNIHIGSKGPGGEQPRDEEQTIRIGDSQMATYIAGISGTTVASGAAVFVDSNGQLGTVTSSKRFKEEIKPMNKTSEAIFSLEPVTFRYKQEMDPAGIPSLVLWQRMWKRSIPTW